MHEEKQENREESVLPARAVLHMRKICQSKKVTANLPIQNDPTKSILYILKTLLNSTSLIFNNDNNLTM